MRSKIEISEMVEKYVSGNLSGEELDGFKLMLENDTEVQSLVKKEQLLQSFISQGALVDIRDQIKDIHYGAKTFPKLKLKPKQWWWLSAIIPTIVVLFTTIVGSENTNGLNEVVKQNIDSTSTNSVVEEVSVNPNTYQSKINPQINTKSNNHTPKQNTKGKNQIIPVDTIVSSDTVKIEEHKTAEIKDSTETIQDLENKKELILPKTEENVLTETVDCSKVKISAIVETKESCNNKPTGTIEIKQDGINGGTPPYSFSLKDSSQFSSVGIFNYVKAGAYKIFIKDVNNCIKSIGTHWVSSYNCEYNFVFAPGKGETWSPPEKSLPGRIKIINKNGLVVFDRTIDYENNFEWNGRDLNDNELSMGNYIFEISYSDKKPIIGTVTIVR